MKVNVDWTDTLLSASVWSAIVMYGLSRYAIIDMNMARGSGAFIYELSARTQFGTFGVLHIPSILLTLWVAIASYVAWNIPRWLKAGLNYANRTRARG